MIPPCVYVIAALLVAAAASAPPAPPAAPAPAPTRTTGSPKMPAALSRFMRTFLSRRGRRTMTGDPGQKEPREASASSVSYYLDVLESCWTEANSSNYRVVIDVGDARKDDVKVLLWGNFMLATVDMYVWFYDPRTRSQILDKMAVSEERGLPVDADTAAATAKLTADGRLVVDFPIDAKAAKHASELRVVPVVETEESLAGVQPNNAKFIYKFYKWLAYLKGVETRTDLTDDNFRVIVKAVNDTRFTKDQVEVYVYGGYLFMAAANVIGGVDVQIYLCDSVELPAHSSVGAAAATITSDGYLVVDIPIDPKAPKSTLDEKLVFATESGAPLEVVEAGGREEASDVDARGDLDDDSSGSETETKN